MLTLDTLARMADRMPSEPFGDGGRPPFRRPDPSRSRWVVLPTVADEVTRALGLFAASLGAFVALITAGGVLANYGLELAGGAPPPLDDVARTALWLAAWTAAIFAPFAAVGLAREVRRYRAVRAQVGPGGWLGPGPTLSSADGTVTVHLAADRRLGASPR